MAVAASEQMPLDMGSLAEYSVPPGATIQQRFEAFHGANPWILEAFEKLTADWLERGHDRIGIGMLTEVVRWQYGRRASVGGFKIDNDYRSRYVRLLIERHPEWACAFSTRKLLTP